VACSTIIKVRWYWWSQYHYARPFCCQEWFIFLQYVALLSYRQTYLVYNKYHISQQES